MKIKKVLLAFLLAATAIAVLPSEPASARYPSQYEMEYLFQNKCINRLGPINCYPTTPPMVPYRQR